MPWLVAGVSTHFCRAHSPALVTVYVRNPVAPVKPASTLGAWSCAPSAPACCHATPVSRWFQVACASFQSTRSSYAGNTETLALTTSTVICADCTKLPEGIALTSHFTSPWVAPLVLASRLSTLTEV